MNSDGSEMRYDGYEMNSDGSEMRYDPSVMTVNDSEWRSKAAENVPEAIIGISKPRVALLVWRISSFTILQPKYHKLLPEFPSSILHISF